MSLPIQITVGGGGTNPAAGATQWNNPAIAGQTGWIEKSGYGPLRFEDYTVLPGGGVQLLNGLAFGAAGELYFWHAVGLAYQESDTIYTNGFRYGSVINALMGRIGFRPHTETELVGLVDSTNQLARSYRYYDDFHAIVKAGKLKAVQPDKSISDVNFNSYLQALQRSAVMRCLNAVFSEKEYIEQRLLCDYEEHTTEQLIPNESKFVGYQIEVADRFDIAVQINGANLLFDTDINGLTLYLFKAGKKTPVWQTLVDVVAYEDTLVIFSDLVLNYVGAVTRGETFYFGYFQDDLGSAKAIRRNEDWEDCTNAFAYESISAAKKVGVTDFDRTQISCTDICYGLRLEVSSFRDWTQLIVKKAPLFDEAIGLTMAAMVIEQIIYSLRGNGTERLLKGGITEASLIQDLTGVAPVSDGPPPVMGLKARLDRELKRVKESFIKSPRAQTINLAND